MASAVGIVLLAAGRSSRMGGADKLSLTLPHSGAPLLTQMCEVALAAGLGPVAVVLSCDFPKRAALVPSGCATVCLPSRGMGESIAAGVQALPDGLTGLLILPSDLPRITAEGLRAFVRAAQAQGGITRATDVAGAPGHPVYFPIGHRNALSALHSKEGARRLLEAGAVAHCIVEGATDDLDTPEDWARFRALTAPEAPEPH